MNKTNRLIRLTALAVVASLLRAQSTPTPASSQPTPVSDETIRLPEFNVSSEKDVSYTGKEALSTTRVGVQLSDLAQSVTVLNKSFLSDVNPTILAKSLLYVGGAQTGTINWSVDRYMLRGFVGEGDFVDGFVTLTDKNTDMNLIDHVEIIKGPAAIFVANQTNTVGGVINKISKNPTSYNIGTITVQTGLWDGNRADLDVGGPITADKKFAYRLLLARQDSKGYYDRTYENRHAILPMLSYKFSDTTELWIKYEDFNSHYSSYNGIPLDGRTNTIAALPYKSNVDGENTPQAWRTDWYYRVWAQFTTRPADWLAIRLAAFDSKDTQRRVEAVINTTNTSQTLADGTVVSVPGYQIPTTYVPGTLLNRSITAINGDYRPRRELQNDYVFSFDTGPVSHKFLTGADLVDYPQDTKTYNNGGTSTATSSPIDPFNPGFPGTVSVNFNQPPVSFNRVQQNFSKVYALETASFLKDRIIANYGVSRSRYESSRTQNNFNQVTGVATADSNVFPNAVAYKNLVQYGLLVKPLPNVSVFYGDSRNFSFNGFGTTPAGVGGLLPPGEGRQKELGAKTTWMDNKIGLNVTYFNIVQFNNTVPAFPQTNPPSVVVVGGETSRGFDGEFSYSFDKNLDMIGSFAYFNAHIDLAAPWNQIVQPGDGRVHSNIPVNNVAQHTAAVWTRYKFTDSNLKGLSIGVGVNYLGKRAIDDNAGSQVFFGYLPARTLVDSVLTYETKQLVFQLNIDNVLNKKYIYASRSQLVQVPGTPTNLRFSVTYKFW